MNIAAMTDLNLPLACRGGSDFYCFFSENIRDAMFSGFLALGGFLLSLQIFIIVKMKEDIYDSKAYRKNIKKLRRIDSAIPQYAPLRRFSKLLSSAIGLSLVTSFLQMSVGLIPSVWSAILCVTSATLTAIFLAFVFFHVNSNLSIWFKCLDEESESDSGK